MKKSSSGAVCVIIASVLWGFFPVFSRLLYADGVEVMHAVSARAIVAGGVFLVWGLIAGVFRGMKLRDWLFELFYGCASILGTYTFYALSIKYLSAAMSSMLLYTAPAFVILFNRVIYKDPITGTKLAALFMTFLGSCLAVRVYDPSSLKVNAVGIMFGLLSGLSYSMLTVIGRYAIKRGSTSLQNTFAPAVAVGVIFTAVIPPWTIQIPGAKAALCFLAVGVIGSVLPYFFYLKGLSSGIDGGFASILANIEPVTATVFGVLIFSDRLELLQTVGIAVVIIGAFLPVLADRRSNAKPGSIPIAAK